MELAVPSPVTVDSPAKAALASSAALAKAALASSAASFQSVIDGAVAANQALYDQRDALKAQILALNLQLNDLNAQIAATETDDVKKARTAVRVLTMIQNGTGGPMMRQFGGIGA